MRGSATTDVQACIDLYTTIWKLFRTRPFTREEVGRRLLERDEPKYVTGEDGLDASLERLVGYGLLEERSSEYEVAAKPDAVAEKWPETASLGGEAVRQLVQSSLVAETSGEDGERGGGGDTLSRDGEEYAVVELRPEDDVETGVRRVVDAVETAAGGQASSDGTGRTGPRGAVVTTPGTNADTAQRIADRLAAEDGGRWEKAGSNVVKGQSDDDELAFRLYLDSSPDDQRRE